MNRKLIPIANYSHVKPLCDVKSERGVPGQGGLGLCDVVRLVVQVVAQEMYLWILNISMIMIVGDSMSNH